MSTKNDTAATPDSILAEMSALGEKAGEAIDQLLSQRKAVLDAAQARVSELDEQIQRLNELYKTAHGRYYVPVPSASSDAAEPAAAGPRTRRTKDELQKTAAAIVEFIAAKGRDGASGAEIKAEFPGVAGSIRDFVRKHAGVSLRDNGDSQRALRYLSPK